MANCGEARGGGGLELAAGAAADEASVLGLLAVRSRVGRLPSGGERCPR